MYLGCLCPIHSIARFTIYRWLKAYNAHGRAGLVPRSTAPCRPHIVLHQRLVRRILALRRPYDCGPVRLAAVLARGGDLTLPHDHLLSPREVPTDSASASTPATTAVQDNGPGNVPTNSGNPASRGRTGEVGAGSGVWTYLMTPAGICWPMWSAGEPAPRSCLKPCGASSRSIVDRCRC